MDFKIQINLNYLFTTLITFAFSYAIFEEVKYSNYFILFFTVLAPILIWFVHSLLKLYENNNTLIIPFLITLLLTVEYALIAFGDLTINFVLLYYRNLELIILLVDYILTIYNPDK